MHAAIPELSDGHAALRVRFIGLADSSQLTAFAMRLRCMLLSQSCPMDMLLCVFVSSDRFTFVKANLREAAKCNS
jgi:hypothetical protein